LPLLPLLLLLLLDLLLLLLLGVIHFSDMVNGSEAFWS